MVCAGIDYGSKKAGTTVISFASIDNQLIIRQSEKNKDADQFIIEELLQLKPDIIAIDAPLSVPPGILGFGEQFFYRSCDKELNAMSPMFLGGMTARAMALKKAILKALPNTGIYETYPKAFVQRVGENSLNTHYKNDLLRFRAELCKYLPQLNIPPLMNWHQADSILAFISALRIHQGKAMTFGLVDEGLIYV